jgi:hypothetical protein
VQASLLFFRKQVIRSVWISSTFRGRKKRFLLSSRLERRMNFNTRLFGASFSGAESGSTSWNRSSGCGHRGCSAERMWLSPGDFLRFDG